MTLELPRTDDVVGPEVQWISPASGLWVATRRGEHAGMVERRDGYYHARSARGRALGSFPDLGSALSVIDGGDEFPRGAPRGAQALLLVTLGGAAAIAAGLAIALLR